MLQPTKRIVCSDRVCCVLGLGNFTHKGSTCAAQACVALNVVIGCQPACSSAVSVSCVQNLPAQEVAKCLPKLVRRYKGKIHTCAQVAVPQGVASAGCQQRSHLADAEVSHHSVAAALRPKSTSHWGRRQANTDWNGTHTVLSAALVAFPTGRSLSMMHSQTT